MPFRAGLKFSADIVRPSARLTEDEEPRHSEPKPPICPTCKVRMIWYQSHLRPQNGRSKIVHSFTCPNCAMVIQIEEPKKLALRVV